MAWTAKRVRQTRTSVDSQAHALCLSSRSKTASRTDTLINTLLHPRFSTRALSIRSLIVLSPADLSPIACRSSKRSNANNSTLILACRFFNFQRLDHFLRGTLKLRHEAPACFREGHCSRKKHYIQACQYALV